MASRVAAVSEETHTIRLVQQVPAGTAGAFVDPIMGASWLPTRKGLNGKGGWVSIEHDPILSDATEFTILLPPQLADGSECGDRLYSFAGSRDPDGATVRAAYFPGDEWIEVYRGDSDLIASGTPIDPSASVNPPQVQLLCRDVMQPLKKTRETGAGFWCHAPRDVFEHYTRLWKPVISDDFPSSLTEFPSSPSSSVLTTSDGKWKYQRVTNGGGASFARLISDGTTEPQLQSTTSWADTGAGDHSCWRAEVCFSQSNATAAFLVLNILDTAGNIYAQLGVNLSAGVVIFTAPSTPTTLQWPVSAAGIAAPGGGISAPVTMAIEARERWLFAYVNGQLVSIGVRPLAPSAPLNLQIQSPTINGIYADVDYVVVRRTSVPLNGGSAGDYFLPSAPAPGGLTGEYFDVAATPASNLPIVPAPWNVTNIKLPERTDQPSTFPSGAPPAWQPAGLVGAFFARWTGAIYLPLDLQDVTFALPSPAGSDTLRLWVGKTRVGEHVLTNFAGDTPISTSVGMRSLFGSVAGWYPIVVEYLWQPTGGSPGAWTGNSNPKFTYNVGGAGTVPMPSVLAPLGVRRVPVNAGDSHYDTLIAIAADYAYQFKSQPMQLESGWFPGAIVPRARVGRDVDKTLTIAEAIDPQLLINAEDVAAALLAAAQGLGGSASGTLTLEAFDFAGLLQHPFVSQEFENLPSTTVFGELVLSLLSLLAYRTSAFEDVQASAPGTREMRDTFLPTNLPAEFDWQPGDGLRVQCPAIFVDDVLPRQILSLRRMLFPDGVGDNQPSFRPRNRTPEQTFRKFLRQVYGDRRTFQGQLVNTPGSRAVAPAYSEAVLPADLTLIRQAQLVVLSKSDATTTFDIEVNGTVQLAAAVKFTGSYNLGAFVGRNNATEPRMLVRLVNPSAAGCQVSYMLRLRELVPSL